MIRPATPDDAHGVAEVQIASWRGAYRHLLTDEQLAGISLAERTEFWRRFPPIIAEAGEVIGFVAVGPRHGTPTLGELYAIYVRPDHWGTGIGRALLQAGEARLREHGYEQAVLSVFADNPQARRFYEVAGWRTNGIETNAELFGMSAPVVQYEKNLDMTDFTS